MSSELRPDAPAPPHPVPPTVRSTLARIRDVPALVRFYMALSPEAQRMYHPFRRNRASLFFIYLGLASWQTLFMWVMRRRRATIRLLMVARVEGTPTIAGTLTLRGLYQSHIGWCVRAGLATAEGYRGLGIAVHNLRAGCLIAYGLGVRWQIGSVFVSNEKLLKVQRGLGARIFPIEARDPYRPEEQRLGTELELTKFLGMTEPAPASNAARQP
jgi:hypothetical protein